jgi:hypothetical protein
MALPATPKGDETASAVPLRRRSPGDEPLNSRSSLLGGSRAGRMEGAFFVLVLLLVLVLGLVAWTGTRRRTKGGRGSACDEGPNLLFIHF